MFAANDQTIQSVAVIMQGLMLIIGAVLTLFRRK